MRANEGERETKWISIKTNEGGLEEKMRECEMTPEAERDSCQNSKPNRYSWRVYPRTDEPDCSSTNIRSRPHRRYTYIHSQTHRNVILHHISLSVYMCTNTLWQAGSFFLSKQELVVTVKLVPQQKLNYFHCLTVSLLRGMAAFEGWRSKFGGPNCLIMWHYHISVLIVAKKNCWIL